MQVHTNPPKDEARKKKEKRNKKSKESSGKDGGKDAAVGVGMLRGEWVCLSAAHEPKELNHVRRDHGERACPPAPRGTSDLRSNNGDGACLSATRGSKDLNNIKELYNTSPSTPSETSTNILSDDDGQEFLNDWDEWSEHEVGNGPRAHWENVHYDFNTGKRCHTCYCCTNGFYL